MGKVNVCISVIITVLMRALVLRREKMQSRVIFVVEEGAACNTVQQIIPFDIQ